MASRFLSDLNRQRFRAGRLLPLYAAGGLLACNHSALAQAPAPAPARVVIDVTDCVQLQSVLERYDCYEARVEQARANASPANATTAETAAAAGRTPARQSNTSSLTRTADPEADAEPGEIRSIVASLEEIQPDRYEITLENGQIWRQIGTQRRFRLRAGHNVRIYSTRWGDNLRLSADEVNGYIQVERVN